MDFNVDPMCSLVLQQVDRTYHVIRELVLDNSSIPEMCQAFMYHFPDHQGEIHLYGDATSQRRHTQTGQTDYWVVLQELKTYSAPIKMRVPFENPKVPDRINAVNRLLLDEDGRVRLLVDPNCVELIEDFEGVLRDQRGGIFKSTNRKDPYFRRTHTSDAAGYFCAAKEPVHPPTDHSTAAAAIPSPRYGHR
jgi:hypothetical protein